MRLFFNCFHTFQGNGMGRSQRILFDLESSATQQQKTENRNPFLYLEKEEETYLECKRN